jgi:hypothetical protein
MGQVSLLSNEQLLSELDTLASTHRAGMARLITHLAELDSRGTFLDLAYRSLFEYCVQRLRFSEDEACRRIDAARLAREYPVVVELLESGAVSLTALSIVKPHVTVQNAAELFAGVAGKTTRLAREWVAAQFPRPDVPPVIRKLPTPVQPAVISQPAAAPVIATETATARVDPAPVASTHKARVAPLSSDRFAFQVSISRSLRDSIDRARDLMRHQNPTGNLEVVLAAAVEALLERLERRKFKRTTRPRTSTRPARHGAITGETRRTVADRDGERCAFVSDDGRRCESRAFLEFDHLDPVGLGGGGAPERVRLLCRAHNQRAAEGVYGREHMERARKRTHR